MNTDREKPTERQNGKSFDVPRKRQNWRPSAALATESLVTGITNRIKPFTLNSARLTGWHEQFTRRLRPWPGWLRQSFEFLADYPTAESQPSIFGTDTTAFANKTLRPNLHRAAVSGRTSVHGTGKHSPVKAQRPETYVVVPAPGMTVAIRRAIRATEALPRNKTGNRALVKHEPAIAERTWRPFFSTGTSAPEDLRTPQSGASPRASHEQVMRLSSLIANTVPHEPRIIRRVSSSPRQEVRGGFPTVQLPPWAMPETEQTTQEVTIPLPEQRAAAPSPRPSAPPQSAETQENFSHSPAKTMTSLPDSPFEPQEAIEKLIQSTILPTSLPGLELRMLAPKEQSPVINAERGQQPGPGATEPPGPAPALPPAPQLNINEVADKVYQTLMRRQQLERERKGLY